MKTKSLNLPSSAKSPDFVALKKCITMKTIKKVNVDSNFGNCMQRVTHLNKKSRKPLVSFMIIILSSFLSCTSGSKNKDTMDSQALEKKLIAIGYSKLFLSDAKLLDSIWHDGRQQQHLLHIISTKESALDAKFLACEVLDYFKVKRIKENRKVLAASYVYALEQTSVEKNSKLGLTANPWGFLYELDDSGYLGKKVISYGTLALPYLKKLLNNNETVLYEGSKEAILGNSYQYRIKDFAAFYCSKITNKPIQFYKDTKDRDAEIERFKKEIK